MPPPRPSSGLAALVLFALAALIQPSSTGAQEARSVVVFAAASLKTALDDVAASWKGETGRTAAISYAASSALARQIEQGAPADIFISADLAWMDYLAENGLIKSETRAELLGNAIVLVAPKDSAAETTIAPGFDLQGLIGDGRLAMADTAAVPAGRYGKAALETLGVWDDVKDSVAEAENVRAALLLVSRGEAPLGIVYRTDAAADASIRIVGTFPEDSHPPVVYPAAVTASATHPDATAFLDYLKTNAARALFERHGFTSLVPATP